ncbi:glycosyltransferase [candidate division KSB1 bacterium]|nr:glycosyltransferase [candidate division KSB1 bacterium]
MNEKLLRVSVITVCKNAGLVIERTLLSVIQQSYPAMEYIIIDGDSKDESLAIINKYMNNIKTVISEPDRGLYDAMNKGVAQATGDYLLFLNAGDYLLHSSVIALMMHKIRHADLANVDIICGNVITFEPSNGTAWIGKITKISPLTLYSGSLPHPATLHRRSAFAKNGLYNTDYKIAADYEWFVRGMQKNKLTFAHLGVVVSVFINDGLSTENKWQELHEQEKQRLRECHYSKRERAIFKTGHFLRKNKLIR